MMRTPLLLALAAATAGCALLRGPSGPTPESELDRGAAAIRAQNFAGAREILEPVYRSHYMDATGQRALLLLTIADLDPRNQNRRLYAAADYATSMLGLPTMPAWEKPVAEGLYLLSQELGGHEEELDRAQAATEQAQQTVAALQRQVQVQLPQTTRESWPAQLKKVEADRDAMAKKVDLLTATLKTRDKDLADANAELERIKKTLKIK